MTEIWLSGFAETLQNLWLRCLYIAQRYFICCNLGNSVTLLPLVSYIQIKITIMSLNLGYLLALYLLFTLNETQLNNQVSFTKIQNMTQSSRDIPTVMLLSWHLAPPSVNWNYQFLYGVEYGARFRTANKIEREIFGSVTLGKRIIWEWTSSVRPIVHALLSSMYLPYLTFSLTAD